MGRIQITYGESKPTVNQWTGNFYYPSIEYLVVAGGGSGQRASFPGGGGAGGFLSGKISLTSGSYSITVGNHADSSNGFGGDNFDSFFGKDSSFSNIIAKGGGAGAFCYNTGGNGGSGGGGASGNRIGGLGVSGQGYNGAAGDNNQGGGGGGAGGPGGTGSDVQGCTKAVGGFGKQSNITGTNTWYAGGGQGAE